MFDFQPAKKLADKVPPKVFFDAVKQSFSPKSRITTAFSFIPMSLAFLLISLYEMSKVVLALALVGLMGLLHSSDLLRGEDIVKFFITLSKSVMNAGLSVLSLIAAPFALIAFPFTKVMAAFTNEKPSSKNTENTSSTSVILSHSTQSKSFEPTRQKNIKKFKAALLSNSNAGAFSPRKIAVDVSTDSIRAENLTISM